MIVLRNEVMKYRMAAGLSMGTLAKKAEIGRTTVWNIEHQVIVPRVDTAFAIAMALGRDINEVFSVEIR